MLVKSLFFLFCLQIPEDTFYHIEASRYFIYNLAYVSMQLFFDGSKQWSEIRRSPMIVAMVILRLSAVHIYSSVEKDREKKSKVYETD